MIRPALPADAGDIVRIYNYYILNTVVSFQEQAVAVEAMEARIREVRSVPLPWVVAESQAGIVGYAFASRWKESSAYRHSVESSIYVDPAALRVGIGSQLYAALLDDLRQTQVHVVIGGIALPNPASVRLHEKLGFQKVAHFKEVGYKFGRWIDVGYWQLTIQRG